MEKPKMQINGKKGAKMTRLERIETYGRWQAKDWGLSVWAFLFFWTCLSFIFYLFVNRISSMFILSLINIWANFFLAVFLSNKITWRCKRKNSRLLFLLISIPTYVVMYSIYKALH